MLDAPSPKLTSSSTRTPGQKTGLEHGSPGQNRQAGCWRLALAGPAGPVSPHAPCGHPARGAPIP